MRERTTHRAKQAQWPGLAILRRARRPDARRNLFARPWRKNRRSKHSPEPLQPTPARIRGRVPPRVGKQPELRAYFFQSGDSQKNGPEDTIHALQRFSSRLFPPPSLRPEFLLSRSNPHPLREIDCATVRQSFARVRFGLRTRPSCHAYNFPTRVLRQCQRG